MTSCRGLIAFDLDGTLVDSLVGIHASLAAACAALQLPVPPPELLRRQIGPPLRRYLPELLQLPPATAEAVVEQLLPHFRRHHDEQGWRHYRLYEGVPDLLSQLAAAGWCLHVVTHKPQPLAEQLLQQEGLAVLFQSVQAPGSPGWMSKCMALRQLIQPDSTSHWYVGNTPSDGEAAAQASYRFVAATYGYGQCAAAHARITTPMELLQVLGMIGPLLLTGASGWFGRTALWEYEQEHGPEALRRDVVPFASRERWVDFDSPHGPVKALPLEAIHAVRNPCGLLHLAFLTRDKVEELGWQRYVDTNREITAHIARLLKAWPTMPVVTTSSGAAAALDGREPDLEGNPYATLKQEEEQLLERQSATRMALVLRVYAASGRFMNRPEKFALGDFLLQAMRGEAVQILTCCEVVRSYVPIGTMMQLVWILLRSGTPAGLHRVDACTVTTSLRELAQLISERYGLSVCPYVLDTTCPPDRYSAEPAEFLNWLSRNGLAAGTLLDQIEETASGLAQQAGLTAAMRVI